MSTSRDIAQMLPIGAPPPQGADRVAKASPAPRTNRQDGASDARERPAPLMDPILHAAMAHWTAGVSPAAVAAAFTDWAQHLMLSPDKQAQLVEKYWKKWRRFLAFCEHACADPQCAACIEPLPQDKRFVGGAWQQWPFNALYQGFLLTQQWWHNATTGVPGVSRHHEDVVAFVMRQFLDMVAPSNFPLTNPEVVEKTSAERGMNLVRGAQNAAEDWHRLSLGEKPAGTEAYEVGRNLAVTPGKVVYRNSLIELIQYAPSSDRVHPEPVLIVPAWIMKYYILDLSRENSLVRYLVEKGHTVFVVSWKNPSSDDRNLGMDDYRHLGVMAAIDAISAIAGKHPLHAVGYCLGGTLLAIVAAAMARARDQRLATLTLFAAQVDFTEPGELSLFIDDSQVQFLDDLMAVRGYLDAREMAGAFQLLRSNDLIWSASVRNYLLGERSPTFDLMAWNADTTRMPHRMHAEYLRRLFLDNELATGRYEVDGRPVSLRDIRIPIFAVSTIIDHVAPWRSVYKIQALTDADVTFVLSNGGHNAGIVNPPGGARRYHQIATHRENEDYVDPEAWRVSAEHMDGSWWPCWQDWLLRHSGEMVEPPPLGTPAQGYAPLCDAPGTYVLMR